MYALCIKVNKTIANLMVVLINNSNLKYQIYCPNTWTSPSADHIDKQFAATRRSIGSQKINSSQCQFHTTWLNIKFNTALRMDKSYKHSSLEIQVLSARAAHEYYSTFSVRYTIISIEKFRDLWPSNSGWY